MAHHSPYLSALAFVSASLIASAVSAAPQCYPEQQPCLSVGSAYGNATLIAGGLSLIPHLPLLVAANDNDAEDALIALSLTGVAAQWLSPPINHWAHGRAGRGFASLGLGLVSGIGIGTLGGAIAGKICEDRPHSEYSEGIRCFTETVVGGYTGAITGLAAWALADAFWLAGGMPSTQATDAEIVPIVSGVTGGAYFGLGGRF
jgi:hypothetical protein